MNSERIDELLRIHRDGLLNDTMPFWMKHGMDWECGGLRNFLDYDGSVYSDDKAIWQTGRFGWITAFLYNEVEPREEWLRASHSCVEFLEKHGFDGDGRMFFEVTREGRPLRKRRYAYAESFCIMAYSEYAKATGDAERAASAQKLFLDWVDLLQSGRLPAKYNSEERPARSHGETMILLSVIQQLRRLESRPEYDGIAEGAWRAVRDLFAHPERKALFETVAPDGSLIDSPAGRCVNPGHAIETSWFLMRESEGAGDQEMMDMACSILDWSLELGWDREYGGLYSFVDIEGKPCEQYEHDMKFAWPHNEAMVACLMAYVRTGRAHYAEWYERVHDWAYTHFPDHRFGDWFRYLHRDGTISSTRKGSHWVSCFHLPRQQFVCWKLLEQLRSRPPSSSRKTSQLSTARA